MVKIEIGLSKTKEGRIPIFKRPPISRFSVTEVKWVMVQNARSPLFEILLAVTVTVPIALLSLSYEDVGGSLIPSKLFNSNPTLFHIFITFVGLAFTGSAIGILLHRVHRRTSRYLSLFGFVCMMIAVKVCMWVFLPSYLKWFPYLLSFLVLLTLFYVHLYKGEKHHHFKV